MVRALAAFDGPAMSAPAPRFCLVVNTFARSRRTTSGAKRAALIVPDDAFTNPTTAPGSTGVNPSADVTSLPASATAPVRPLNDSTVSVGGAGAPVRLMPKSFRETASDGFAPDVSENPATGGFACGASTFSAAVSAS